MTDEEGQAQGEKARRRWSWRKCGCVMAGVGAPLAVLAVALQVFLGFFCTEVTSLDIKSGRWRKETIVMGIKSSVRIYDSIVSSNYTQPEGGVAQPEWRGTGSYSPYGAISCGRYGKALSAMKWTLPLAFSKADFTPEARREVCRRFLLLLQRDDRSVDSACDYANQIADFALATGAEGKSIGVADLPPATDPAREK